MPLTEWRSQFDVTFFGPITLTQQLLPHLRASRGRVINVTSIGGVMPGPMIAAYQAAKAALEAVSDSMRIEFSPFGVHVSAIEPGSIFHLDAQTVPGPAQQTRRCPAEKPSARLRGSRAGVREDRRVRPKIFNLSGEGFADDPPGGDGASSPTRYLIGMDAKMAALLKHNLPDRWMDAIVFWMFGLPRQVKHQEDE